MLDERLRILVDGFFHRCQCSLEFLDVGMNFTKPFAYLSAQVDESRVQRAKLLDDKRLELLFCKFLRHTRIVSRCPRSPLAGASAVPFTILFVRSPQRCAGRGVSGSARGTLACMDESQSVPPPGAAPPQTVTHTLTIPEVCSRFAAAGVPRAERTIQTYCQLGTLDCIRVPGELGPKYLVSEVSVENRIREFVQMQQLLDSGATGARSSAHERVGARSSAHERASAPGAADEAAANDEGLKKLQEELISLKSEVRARDAFINMLQAEKKDQFERLWNYTTKIAEQSREIGRLEERLAIDAPKSDYPHSTTPEGDTHGI